MAKAYVEATPMGSGGGLTTAPQRASPHITHEMGAALTTMTT